MSRSVWKGPFVEQSLIKKVDKEKNNPKPASNLDPREKLANRLKKYIARQSKIPLDEIERRTDRKQKALNYASNWLCLALIAREQNLEMEQIITALSS